MAGYKRAKGLPERGSWEGGVIVGGEGGGRFRWKEREGRQAD